MSDLDADLYGDLYGIDDNEFAVPTTEQPEQQSTKDSPEQPEQPEEEQRTTANSIPSQEPPPATTSAKPSTPASQLEETKFQPASAPQAINTIPSYMSPPTQQIPTYEERQPTDLHSPPARRDVGYQGVAGVDRPVRPSEMKEEG
ncbi:hypothetical protein BD414DRAFT_67229 [Trametes punicea]|nr:hypothetical protein BD414DRAFT_67229 [Trametes punicea]